MTIRVIKEPDIYLTEAELARYRHEYAQSMRGYAGPPIPFETWVRRRKNSDDYDGRILADPGDPS